MDLKRRDFFKLIGVTTVGSALPGCEREAHNLVPYLLPDEEIIPGIANWYASYCRECPAGCGILVRVMEGRAKKIEGNPSHPLNQGKLCARGHAALQDLYNPDRLRGPMRREGPRGEGTFRPIGWEEAFSLWVSQLKAHQNRTAMISRPVRGTLAEIFSRFMKAQGGPLVLYDAGAAVNEHTANRANFGIDQWPHYDLANSTFLLSFGTPFLDDWLSPVSFGAAFGRMRQGRAGMRGRFVQIEPRLSLTAASADRWIPIRPGSEGLLALGIGQLILAHGRSQVEPSDRRKFETVYRSHPMDHIVQQTGITQDEIERLAEEFATASTPLALGGGPASSYTNSTITMQLINGLNVLVGNIGRPGGVQIYDGVQFPGHDATVQPTSEQTLLEIAQAFDQGRYSLLQLYQANPLYSLPPSTGMARLFMQAPFIVSFSSYLDESTAMSDLILPDHAPLESWGDHPQNGLSGNLTVGLGQPVVEPLYDTRSVGDLFLQASHHLLDMRQDHHPLPAHPFKDRLQANWQSFLADQTSESGDTFDLAWTCRLQEGGWWTERANVQSKISSHAPSDYEPAAFAGDDKEYPFYLSLFPAMGVGRGEGSNRPWLQELPDTLTSAVWGSWVEINPKTARDHNLRSGELLRITSPHGRIEVPVVFFPGIRPDTIALPMGQGHWAYGRYATGRGVNPMSILAPLFDTRSGALATGATRVRIEGTGQLGKLALLEQRHEDKGHELITIGRRQPT